MSAKLPVAIDNDFSAESNNIDCFSVKNVEVVVDDDAKEEEKAPATPPPPWMADTN